MFYENPFAFEFRGSLVQGDRQYSPTFICPRNFGRTDDVVVAWNDGPYSFSGTDAKGDARRYLNFAYGLDADNFANWTTFAVDFTAVTLTAAQVVAALNANTPFSGYFTATIETGKIKIKQKLPVARFKFYIVNGQAEEALKFNARVGVAELPSYFSRHEIGGTDVFADSCNTLIPLDPSNPVEAAVIDNAVNDKNQPLHFDHTVVQEDWQLLRGRSGLFQFTLSTSSTGPYALDHTITDLVVPAGAKAGDLVKKVVTQYESGGAVMARWEVPHVLTTAEESSITPPPGT